PEQRLDGPVQRQPVQDQVGVPDGEELVEAIQEPQPGGGIAPGGGLQQHPTCAMRQGAVGPQVAVAAVVRPEVGAVAGVGPGGAAPSAGSGGRPRALAITRPRLSSLYVGGRPGRGASSSPSKPAALKRSSRARTVFSASPSPRAIAGAVAPAADRSTISARRARRTGAVCERARRASFARSSSVRSRTNSAIRTPPRPRSKSCTRLEERRTKRVPGSRFQVELRSPLELGTCNL